MAVVGKQLLERYLVRKRHGESRPQAAAKFHLLRKGKKLDQLYCLPLLPSHVIGKTDYKGYPSEVMNLKL